MDDLPRWGKGGKAKEGTINWNECVNKKVAFIYDELEGEIEIVGYNNSDKLLIVVFQNEKFFITTPSLKECEISRIIGRKTSDFKININKHFKDKGRDLIITDRKIFLGKDGIKRKKYKYKCNNCGFECGEHYKCGECIDELWVDESFLLVKKGGCPCCCHNPQIVCVGINDINITNPELVRYFQGGYSEAKKYTFRSNQEIYPICPECGNIKTKPIKIDRIYENQGINCSCGDGFSYGHKYIFSMLKQLKVSFKDNVRFNWCKYKIKNRTKQGEYDFVIEDKKIILEVDGYFHRNDNNMNGQTKELSGFIDGEKDRLAKENGYLIIRLAYNHQNKKQLNNTILSSEVVNHFNLESIDWKLCNEYALNNISKLVATYWNNKKEWETTTDLMEYFGLSRNTILNYLNVWTELGYCNYESSLESKKRYEKLKVLNKEKCNKKVEVFKDGISEGIYDSLTDLCNKFLVDYNIKLQIANISSVCLGKRKSHKGYTFKYLE